MVARQLQPATRATSRSFAAKIDSCVSYFIPLNIFSYFCFLFHKSMKTFFIQKYEKIFLFEDVFILHLFGCSHDNITLLSLHSAPRDGCDRHRLHPHARHRTHFHRVVKHDRVEYPCCMLELPSLGHTQVLACAPRLRGDVTV